VLLVWLTLVWVGLWGSASAANVLGGIAIALVLLLALPLDEVPDQDDVHAAALLRFLGRFVVDLVRASLQVALLVVHPRVKLHQAVLAVPVRGASDRLLTLLANAISLTPGTLTLEVDRPRSTLYVHVLDVGAGGAGLERVRADILRVENLAVRAVGSVAGRAALDEAMQDATEVPQ
jgi:multicomponent Na+:H+ antiporter subunit E